MQPQSFKPSYCVWELTLACDLRCGHCGSRAGAARPDEMSTTECLGVVESLAQLGCEVITLSGGEPTLRSDWQEIACAIRDHGMIANMVTNGYALDRALACRMKEAGLANVAVSIDGTSEVHERIRGRGTFERTSRALMLLAEAGVPTTVMTTINTLNLPLLSEIYDIAVAHHAERWRVQLGKPMGNLAAKEDWVIKPKHLLRLLPELHALHEQGPLSVGIGDSIGYYGPYDSALRAHSWRGAPQCWAGCQAGMRAIGVESNGGIKGCLSLQAFRGEHDRFLEGNVRERPLSAIWNDPEAFGYNRRFCEDQLQGACRRCGQRAACRGGARCVASAVCGDIGEDPYCYLRVANEATRWPTVGRKQVATAASVVSLFLAGCSNELEAPLQQVEEIPCSELCCTCDDPGAPAERVAECCEPVDPCANVCCDCDYGTPPPAECCQPVDPCADVCCDCDYGTPPPAECCEPIDPCADVCCECEYGTPPPAECCEPIDPCADVCCECDYGMAPPAGCCEPIDCSTVCCDCEYGVLPPAVEEKCCKGETP